MNISDSNLESRNKRHSPIQHVHKFIRIQSKFLCKSCQFSILPDFSFYKHKCLSCYKWTKFEKMNVEVTVKKKGYKQIFIPVTVGLTKLVSDIQSPCFGSILGECRSLILSLSLFLSFKLYGAKQLIFTQGKKPNVTSDKLQEKFCF